MNSRKTPTEHYMQEMTKILWNVQCLVLGFTDLKLNRVRENKAS